MHRQYLRARSTCLIRGGSLFLLAERIENHGTLSAPGGESSAPRRWKGSASSPNGPMAGVSARASNCRKDRLTTPARSSPTRRHGGSCHRPQVVQPKRPDPSPTSVREHQWGDRISSFRESVNLARTQFSQPKAYLWESVRAAQHSFNPLGIFRRGVLSDRCQWAVRKAVVAKRGAVEISATDMAAVNSTLVGSAQHRDLSGGETSS